jgi:hypothetical protein
MAVPGSEERDDSSLASANPEATFHAGGACIGPQLRFWVQINVDMVAGEGHAVFLFQKRFGAFQPVAREVDILS